MRSSHDTADPALVEALVGDAALGDRLARGARLRVHPRARGYRARPLRRRDPQAAPAGRRPHGQRDRRRRSASGARRAAATATLEGHALRSARAASPEAGGRRSRSTAARCRSRPTTVVLAAGGRCFAEAEQRGELSTNHPNATGEVTRIAPRRRCRGARPRRAPVPPERRRLAGDDAGLRDPRDDPRVRRGAPQRRAARSSPTRSARATRSPRRSSTRSRPGAA